MHITATFEVYCHRSTEFGMVVILEEWRCQDYIQVGAVRKYIKVAGVAANYSKDLVPKRVRKKNTSRWRKV